MIWKYCLYALLMLIAFVLQSSRGTALSLWGASLDVMPFFVAAAALLDGPYAGGAFGAAAGVLLTLNTAGTEGLWSLYLALFGTLFGLFGAYYLRNILPSALCGGGVCIVIGWTLRYIFHDLLIYGMPLLQALRGLAMQLVLSLPMGALMYLLLRAVHRRFTEEVQ